MDRIIIDNQQLTQELRRVAEEENRSIDEVLSSLLQQYRSARSRDAEAGLDADQMIRQVRRSAYERARRFWRETGNQARLALTDEELNDQFWLFDPDGVPRLRSEGDQVNIPDDSLYRLGEVLEELHYRSGHFDVAAHSKEILRAEFADYLLRRMNRPNHDAHSSTRR